jgi:endonuclease-3 related protein
MNKLQTIYKKLYNAYGKQNWWPITTKHRRWEVIVGAILTQNTSWKNVEKAISNLNQAKALGMEKIKQIKKQKLAKLIKPSGYFNQKAERLKIAAEFFSKNNKPTREQLLKVKGIGPETADSILLYAYSKPVFVIDLYTKRIFSRVGMCKSVCSYDELQNIFHKSLKKDSKMFNEYHALIVELAKQHCKKKPECRGCPIYSNCKRFI